jgi:hypothetical protein
MKRTLLILRGGLAVERNIGATDLRQRLTDVLQAVRERGGTYIRYRRLIEAEQELLRTRLQQASAAASARAAHLTEEEVDELVERARSEVHQAGQGT